MNKKSFSGGWRKRPKEATGVKALELKQKGLTLIEISKIWGVTRQQVYNLIQREKASQMTPDERQVSRALDCLEWLSQFVQGKYDGKTLRRLNLYLREIKNVLEREIPICQTKTGLESTVKNPAPSATMATGVQSVPTEK